jgi:hypothetical protein
MKKIIYLSAFACLVVLGTSCGKKYTCTCTQTNGTTTTTDVKGASKDIAQATCIAKSNSSQTCVIL